MTCPSNTHRVFAAAMFAVVLIALSGCVADTRSRTLPPYQEWILDGSDYPIHGGQ